MSSRCEVYGLDGTTVIVAGDLQEDREDSVVVQRSTAIGGVSGKVVVVMKSQIQRIEFDVD